jgi:anion transporter
MSQASLMLVILAVTVVAFVFAKWNFWITALLAEIVLMLTQILTPIEAFSGFSDKNVVLIVCMMIIGAGIGKTSIVYTVKEFLAKQNGNERKLVFVILLAVALVAQFLSPATTLGVILPIIMAIGDDSKGLTASRIVYPIMAVAHYFASIVPVGIGATVPLQDNAMMLSMGVTAEFKVTDIFFNCIWGAVAMLIYFVFAYKTLPQKPRYGTDISSAVKEVKKSDLNPVQEKMAYLIFALTSLGLILGSLTNWWSIYLVGPIGAAAMVLTGVLKEKEFFSSIPWPMVFLMAFILPLAGAMQKTGAGELVGNQLASLLYNVHNNYLILLIFFLFGSLMTQFMSNTAAWYILVPIATSAALSMHVNPLSLVAVVDMASATSILTPMASPGMAIAFSVGRYSFKDLLKTGLPIWIISGLISITAIYLRFPMV